MLEQKYQSKIIKEIEKRGGVAVNGRYSKGGIPDLQCGISVYAGHLRYVAVEVKTEKDYKRVMDCLYEVGGLLHIKTESKGLKDHEILQVHKINDIRKRKGLALFAHCFKQVEMYIYDSTT